MKKNFTFLIAALMLLTTFAIPTGMKGQTTVTQTSFSAISGKVDNDTHVSFAAYKGGGTSNPAVNSGAIRLYQNSSSATGGYIVIGVDNGYEITSATIQSTMATTTGYLLTATDPKSNTPAKSSFDVSDYSLSANTDYTVDSISTQYITFACFGTSSSSRLYLSKISITYQSTGGGQTTTYTVTYHANVTGTADIEVEYNEGDDVTVAANTFSNPGYTFTEWNTEANGSGDSYDPGDQIEDIDDDIDLYAQWAAAASNEMTLNFSLTSNPNDWPTTTVSSLTNYTYPLNSVDYTFALKNVKYSSSYLMVYYVGVVGLPAIEGYKLTKVVASNSSGCSTATKVGISSSASQESYIAGGEIQTWSTQGSNYTYNLTSTEVNTMYYLYVTNKNAQVTGLALTYEAAAAPTVPTPTFNYADGTTFGNEGLSVEISCATNNASIYYTLDGSTPDNSSNSYNGAINLTTTTTINAIAYDGTNYSNVATATYTYVDPNGPGTENNPYTVAQARAAIDAGTGITDVYATGIISQVDSYNSNYNSITYWISEDGTTTSDQLEVYSGKGLNNADFSSMNDVEVGATVVVFGTLKKYNSTYEFDKNNYLTSYTAPQHAVEAPAFSPAAGTYADAQSVTISCTTSGADIYYTLDGADPDANSTLYSSAINVTTTTTIKAIAYLSGVNSTIATATYHINSQANPYTVAQALAFNEYPANGIYVNGIVSTAPTQAPNNNGELTYYISDDGTTAAELEIYKGKGLNQAAFTAQDDIQAGDIVTVYGNVQVYNNTIEFAQGNYLVAFEHPTPVLNPYDLTVSTLNEHITALYVYDANNQNNPLITDGLAGTVQVLEGTDIIVSPVVESGYILQSLTVLDDNDVSVQPEDHMSDGGYYSFTMPSGNVTISATAVVAPATEDYELFSGTLVEGDYIIYYDGSAMKNTVESSRLYYETVSPNNDVISTSDATIVWHIAPSGAYWTIYSADAQAYAASTGAKNKAQMLADGTDDKALWDITEVSGTYDFVNYYNNDNSVNAYLRKNGTYGFACYANTTGGALSLYKKVATETYTFTIEAYTHDGSDQNPTDGWYLIASPVAEDITPSASNGFFKENTTYDLFRFNQSATNGEWENYTNHSFVLENGKGYLYANSVGTELTFTGTPISGTEKTIGLVYNSGATLPGVNLVGNPFPVKATMDMSCYVMNSARNGIEASPVSANTAIDPFTGVFVVAESENQSVTFTKQSQSSNGSKNNNGYVNLVLCQQVNRGNATLDKAVLSFNDGDQLGKFYFGNQDARIYIPQNGKEFAIVSSEPFGTMPVNFRTEVSGSYTLNINVEKAELNYLHLIDNMTGADLDLLVNPSYTFNATNLDYESRFTLVFSNSNTESAEGNEDFAFINNGNLIVAGTGTLQIVDMMGRVVNTFSTSDHVNTNSLANGVYVIRLVNGENVKTQKIVVK